MISGNINASSIDDQAWVFRVQTYNRVTDTVKFYWNGALADSSTNGQGDASPTGDAASKFGYFGKVR